MPQTKLFKENLLAAGIKTPDDVISFEFELNDGITGEQIDHIVPDCGVCTKAKLVGNKIVGTVTLSKAQVSYNPGKTPVTKNVYVYLNDGHPRFIGKDKTKEVMANPDKQFERLNIACVVNK